MDINEWENGLLLEEEEVDIINIMGSEWVY